MTIFRSPASPYKRMADSRAQPVSVSQQDRDSREAARAAGEEDDIRGLLVGCAVFAALLAVGIALLSGVDWAQTGTGGDDRSKDEELELARVLAREFGDQPEVVFVCRFAVIGEAPCLPGDGVGTREVTLTFTGSELPTGVDPQEHARRIAVVAYKTSRFVSGSNKTVVVFHEGDESASVLRKYSFGAGELAVDRTQ